MKQNYIFVVLCRGFQGTGQKYFFVLFVVPMPRDKGRSENTKTNSYVPGQNHYLIGKKKSKIFQKIFFWKICTFFLLSRILYRDKTGWQNFGPAHGKMSKFCPNTSCSKSLSLSCCTFVSLSREWMKRKSHAIWKRYYTVLQMFRQFCLFMM